MLKTTLSFLNLIVQKRSLIWELAKRDIQAKYVGSILGIFWCLIHPLTMILVFWFVFGYGLRSQPVQDVPFTLWLIAGLAPWFLFSEIISESTTSITANAHLIKKIVFPSQILPLVKVVSSFFNHLIFITIFIALAVLKHTLLPWYVWQCLYFYFCVLCLSLGISWLTSSINVFIRDTNQFVQLILQILFWGTPIVWDISIMPEGAKTILALNPMYYIVHGYRMSLIYGQPFWQEKELTVHFWIITLVILFVGATVFRKLKPHFDDVL